MFTYTVHKIRTRIHGLSLLGLALFLSGCVAAAPLVIVGLGGIIGTQMYNALRDQYPDVDFEEEAPIEVTYQESQREVFDTVIETLEHMGETIAIKDRDFGVIETKANNLNETNWLQKSLGEATFYYQYKIICRDSSVKANVRFSSEKFFTSEKENIPEGANMMRHVLFERLNKRLTKVSEKVL